MIAAAVPRRRIPVPTPMLNGTCQTATEQVYCLARAVFAREFGEVEAIRQSQRLAVSSFDTFCLQIVHELREAFALVADGKGADVDGGLRMAIPNSSCTGGGLHS